MCSTPMVAMPGGGSADFRLRSGAENVEFCKAERTILHCRFRNSSPEARADGAPRELGPSGVASQP